MEFARVLFGQIVSGYIDYASLIANSASPRRTPHGDALMNAFTDLFKKSATPVIRDVPKIDDLGPEATNFFNALDVTQGVDYTNE